MVNPVYLRVIRDPEDSVYIVFKAVSSGMGSV